MRTTEQIASETLDALLAKLGELTAGQPTTAELEEALLASRAITRALVEWLASRYCAQAAARKAYGIPVQVPTATPEEDEALDVVEAQQVQNAHVSAVFAPLLKLIYPPRPA